MSKRRLRSSWVTVIASIVTLALPAVAVAHRLDEYLQATRVSLALDRVVLEIDLIPGVDVAPMIFASINTNRDSRISAAEGRAYANQVLKDLVLELDGRRQHVALVASQFPSFEEMSAGMGTIRIEARAAVSAGDPGRHSLFYQNTHMRDMGVYLVNALLPASSEIEITEQHRDARQHGIRLGFTVTPAAAGAAVSPFLLIVGLALSALFGYGYRRYTAQTRKLGG